MRARFVWVLSFVVLGATFAAAPVPAATLGLNYFGGSLGDPIEDSAGSPLGTSNFAFLYASSSALGPADLFTVIFNVLGGGGLELAAPSNLILTTAIGAGISPPINLDGRLRGTLELGDTFSPLLPVGTLLHLIAVDATSLALATEAGISADVFSIPSLPSPGDVPLPPVEFSYGGFATVPEPGTIAMMGLGLAGLQVARRRRR